jgi:hypothetical protein
MASAFFATRNEMQPIGTPADRLAMGPLCHKAGGSQLAQPPLEEYTKTKKGNANQKVPPPAKSLHRLPVTL